MTPWTPDECRLLRTVPVDVGALIAGPTWELQRWREATHSGCGPGYRYAFGKTALEGEWHTWPSRGAESLLSSARIGYTRLLRWAEALPDDIREQARRHYATYPVDTRNLARLEQLVLELIPDPGPPATADQRNPVRDLALPPMPPAEPNDLLELLEMTA